MVINMNDSKNLNEKKEGVVENTQTTEVSTENPQVTNDSNETQTENNGAQKSGAEEVQEPSVVQDDIELI